MAGLLAKYRSRRHARSGISSGRVGAGAISKSDAAAIDMASLSGIGNEGEVANPGSALGLVEGRFGRAITERRVGRAASHQPSLSSRRGSRDRLNLPMMIFLMFRSWAAGWQG